MSMPHFGHIFEICADGNLVRELDEINAMNERVASGQGRPGDRQVTVHVIEPPEPVPVDYLYFRNAKQMRPVIQAGREYARRYLDRVKTAAPGPAPVAAE